MPATVAARPNADLLEEKYALWKNDPRSVEVTWAAFFEGFELGLAQPPKRDEPAPSRVGTLTSEDLSFRARVANMVFAYRALGHTAVWLDPLSPRPDLPATLDSGARGFSDQDLEVVVATQFFRDGRAMPLRDMRDELRAIYCDRIGFEFMHIQNADMRSWLVERIEDRPPDAGADDDGKKSVLQWLVEAESFERFLHAKYVGQKRFSIEGGESLVVALQGTFEACPAHGVKEIVMGMAHRGRLSMLAAFLREAAQGPAA